VLVAFSLGSFSSKLKTLDFSGLSTLTDQLLSIITARTPNLEELRLDMNALTDISISNVIRKCPKLRVLTLSATNITDNSILLISETLGATLEEIGLGFCHPISEETLLRLFTKCPNLHTINIVNQPNFSDQVARVLMMQRKLRFLNARDCVGLTEVGVLGLIRSVPTLTHAIFTGCNAMIDSREIPQPTTPDAPERHIICRFLDLDS